MFQQVPCTGADRRKLRCSHEARYASASEVPAVCHWICFLYGLVFSVISPDCRPNKVNGRLRELLKKKLSVFFSAGTVQSAVAWPPVNCACVPNFLNSLLIPRVLRLFSRNWSVNLFDVYPYIYKLFITILSSSLNIMLIVDKHCSDVCCDEFPMPQIDRKSK